MGSQDVTVRHAGSFRGRKMLPSVQSGKERTPDESHPPFLPRSLYGQNSAAELCPHRLLSLWPVVSAEMLLPGFLPALARDLGASWDVLPRPLPSRLEATASGYRVVLGPVSGWMASGPLLPWIPCRPRRCLLLRLPGRCSQPPNVDLESSLLFTLHPLGDDIPGHEEAVSPSLYAQWRRLPGRQASPQCHTCTRPWRVRPPTPRSTGRWAFPSP